MPKSLKWGILIAACMLLLFAAGHIFKDQLDDLLGDVFCTLPAAEDVATPLSENGESASPWEN